MCDENTRLGRYQEYLRSTQWSWLREQAMKRAGKRCQVCNGTTKLAAHHRTYERVYHEQVDDLTILCALCHGVFHGRRPSLTDRELRRVEAAERISDRVWRAV